MRQYLLATVFTMSATSTYASALLDNNTHTFSPNELTGLSIEDLKSTPAQAAGTQSLDFSKLTQAASPLGYSTPLDLRGYGNALKQVILPTSASNVLVPSGTKIIFVGAASALNLSKIQADGILSLDLSSVTGMDKPYGADSYNSLPSATRYAKFPSNATEISVPALAHTVIAPAAITVHIVGDTFKGIPNTLSNLPELTKLNMNKVPTEGKVINISHLPDVISLSLDTSQAPSLLKMNGAKTVTLTGAGSVPRIEFTSDSVTKAAVDAAKDASSANIELLNPAADHSTVLSNELNLFKFDDTTADKNKVVAAISNMGIENIKTLKLKASHLQYVMEQFNITDLTGFSMLEKLELVDATGAYAAATLPSTSLPIAKADLPSSITEFYSANSVVIKGAMSSGALTAKFNATNLDLSEATGLTSLSAGSGFTASSIHALHLPEDLDLSVAGNRTFAASLSGLTHLYIYGTSSMTDLQAGNVPASVTHLDVSNSSVTTALPALANTITHVTVSAAYLAANTASDKFATFTKFAGENTPANKTLVVTGAAGGALTTSSVPNVGIVDLRTVTGATSFSAALDKTGANTNLAQLYLPSAFDVTAAADILSNVSNNVTIYISGAYPSAGGSKTLDPSYANSKLDFSAVTGGGLFRVPATIRSLVLSDGVGSINGDAAAVTGVFDLKALTQLTALSGLPVAATTFRMNNSSGTAFALDLSQHVNLTELSLNSSKVTYVSLPAASGLTTGGFGASSLPGHLNLSGLTGLTIDADHPNPIRGLSAFSNAATSIDVITLPRELPSNTVVDLSAARETIYVRNLHKADRVTPHATALQLAKPSTTHGIYDRTVTALWAAYIEEMISSATYGGLAETSLDLSESAFSPILVDAQAEVNAFFAALHEMPAGSSAGQKGIVQNIHMRIPDALAAGTLYIGRIIDNSTPATDLNTTLRVSTHKAGGLTVTAAGGNAGEVQGANLLSDSSSTGFTKTNAVHWQSYLMYLLDNSQSVLDAKAVTIGMDSHATAFQTALASLTSRLKDRIRSIVLRLTTGAQAPGSFASNADKLTLDVSSLDSLETLFVDLNQSTDGGSDAVDAVDGDGITLPSSATLIGINKYVAVI